MKNREHRGMNMQNENVLIGKVTQSTANMLELDYPSTAGISSVRLPRTMVARF